MGKAGKMYGIYTYGVIATVCAIYIHHVQVLILVRNWTFWLFCWCALSLLFLAMTCALAQMGQYVEMRKAIYSQLLPSLHLDATILLIVGAASAPILFHKYVHRLILWPKFYMQD